jgi:ribonuclease T1
LSSLPVQASATVRLIKAGGPFPYSQDGVVFSNNEKLLPNHPHGYYHEYTVPTPGASDRSTRRIVTGSAGEYYYTGDHYVTFRQIDLTR